MEVMLEMAKTGLEASISDAGVGALAARAGVQGAFLNVKINTGSYNDKDFVEKVIKEGTEIEKKAIEIEKEVLKLVESKI
jgi:glutamate formiminotransferase/formiminotetrahydrofolate cyclodeaminase